MQVETDQKTIYEKCEELEKDMDQNEMIKRMKNLQEFIQTLSLDKQKEFFEQVNKQMGEDTKECTVRWIEETMINYGTFRITNPTSSIFVWVKSLTKDNKDKLRICLEMGGCNWREFEWARKWLLKEHFQTDALTDAELIKIEKMRIQDARESIVAYMFQGMFINLHKTSGGKAEGFELVRSELEKIRNKVTQNK